MTAVLIFVVLMLGALCCWLARGASEAYQKGFRDGFESGVRQHIGTVVEPGDAKT